MKSSRHTEATQRDAACVKTPPPPLGPACSVQCVISMVSQVRIMIRLLVHLAALRFCLSGNIKEIYLNVSTFYSYSLLRVVSSINSVLFNYFLAEPSKNSVAQSPGALIKHPGEEVRIDCNHSNTDFDMIQWYKQSAGESDMLLVGYVRFNFPVLEAPFKDSYNVSGNGGSRACLHIPKPGVPEDGAVYFCAASRAQCCTAPSL